MAKDPSFPTLWSERFGRDPMTDMRRAMTSLFGEPMTKWAESGALSDFSPALDESETDGELRLTLEIPGVDEKDIHVTVSGDRLTVRGEKKSETKDDRDEQGRVYHRVERTFGSFQRTISLPFRADPDAVKAEFAKGVLTVTLAKPKDVAGQPRRIAVQTKS